jgi:hypothetical protein
MVFECTLDYLVQKVGRQQFMDVGPRKMGCERLVAYVYKRITPDLREPHNNIANYPISVP